MIYSQPGLRGGFTFPIGASTELLLIGVYSTGHATPTIGGQSWKQTINEFSGMIGIHINLASDDYQIGPGASSR